MSDDNYKPGFTDEELVVLVRQYSHLYDPADPNYHNQLIRKNTWEEIGQNLKTSGYRCKAKWKSLRESYRKALLVRKKSSQAAKKMKTWRLESQMEFVRQSLISQSDKQESNIPPPSPASVVSSCSEESQSFNLEDSESDGRNTMPNENKKCSSATAPRSAAEILQNYIITKMKKPKREGDELRKFFLNIEERVRTLPPDIQIKLKSQISRLVDKAELENMENIPPVSP